MDNEGSRQVVAPLRGEKRRELPLAAFFSSNCSDRQGVSACARGVPKRNARDPKPRYVSSVSITVPSK